jgi:hypothetical protein
MDARCAADAIKSRQFESDKSDARGLAEMLRTGWFFLGLRQVGRYSSVNGAVGARAQLAKLKRS